MGQQVVRLKAGLPYIIIPTNKGNLKFLVDCGANVNLISKKWANSANQPLEKIKPKTVHGVTGKSTINEKISLDIFQPMRGEKYEFFVFDFHTFFDGLIGTGIIFNKAFNLVSAENALQIKGTGSKIFKIKLNFYNPKPTPRANYLNLETTVRTKHLTAEEKNKLLIILNSVNKVFHNPDDRLTCTTNVKCQIRTTDDYPVYQKSYPYPVAYKEEVEKQIEKLLADGIIRPSRSPWNSPVWIVPKKMDASGEKKFRLVIDYRKLNEKTISDTYPMPEISNILDQLGGNQYFTTLDLASGFHQIEMDPRDIEKTAFSINYGKYEYTRMPFGLKNAPAIFQRGMDDVLRKHIGKRCYVYMDDVVVFGKTLEEHLENLKIVLETLQSANLKVQLDKSEFLHNKIEFLGYIIAQDGIMPNKNKIEAIEKFPEPKTIKQLRGFLGLLGYYRRFIKDFAKVAKPLTTLLRGVKSEESNKKINLDSKQVKCFNDMKRILTSGDILVYPDFTKPFLLTCDASDFAIGAVLSQGEFGKDKPIHFASRTLNTTEERYSASEKELLAIVWGLKNFRNYLYGHKVLIYTDHQPITYDLNSKNANKKLIKWKSFINSHDHHMNYIPGKTNVVADALSRIQINSLTPTQHSADDDDSNYIPSTEAPLNVFRNQVIIELDNVQPDTTITHPFPGFRRVHIKRTRLTDEILTAIMKDFFDPSKVNGLYTSENILGQLQEIFKKYFARAGILKVRFTQKLLTDVTDEEEQDKIIEETHKRAHRGIDECKQQILRRYYFPSTTKKLKLFIRVCDICNTSKYDRHPLRIELQETPIPNHPFDIIHIDIYQTEKQLFLSSVDKFSKYGRMIPIKSHQTQHVKKAFLDTITSNLVPSSVVTDNEKAFMSPDIRGMLLDLNITLYVTPSSKSEVNGQVERFHSTITEMYRIQKALTPQYCCKNLMCIVVEKYNNTIHSTIKKTPKEVLLGKSNSTTNPEQLEEIRTKMYDELLVNLKEKQLKQLETHNKSRQPPVPLVVGQEIYVKDKLIKPKHHPRFKRHHAQTDNIVTFRNENNSKLHKSNIKNINLRS